MFDKHDPLYENVHKILGKKDPENLKMVNDLALSDRDTLEDLLNGLTSDNDIYRYNCFQVIFSISEKIPLKLYSEWNRFYELMKSENAYHQMIGVKVLANLTLVDTEELFEEIKEAYFGLLDGKSFITARYVAAGAGKIAYAKPHLQEFIAKKLLAIDKTHHKNKELIVYDAIDSFESFFKEFDKQDKIISFVKKHLKSNSPKTAKKASEFINNLSK